MGRRCVFTWNHDRVPQPEKMVGYFHSAHMRVAANIKPYLLRAHPNYNNVAEAGGFVKNAEANEPEAAMFWSGGAYESELGAFIDFTSEAGYTWWQRKVKEQLFTYGIDVTWNDNNEFEIWDDEARLDGFGEGLRAGLARPLLTLLMNRASYEITRDTYPDRRPFQLSRSGCPGVSRYAQMWSGDNHTDWHTLRYNIPMGLGMSLSGAPNIGHDVGGFGGPKPDPELFLRWVQNGVFHPRFTIHSWNTDATVNEPWMFPEMTAYIRDAIRLRYRLLPYFYSLFYDAHRIGQPIIRPLVYHFPDDPNCHDASFDFLLGPYLLVASVTEPGARRRQVYLPAGTRWCDYHTGRWYEGGQTINVEAPLDRIPLFVRAGGMLPFGRAQRYVGEMPDNVRVIYAYPDPDDEGHPETFTLYEDDGESNRYHDGAYELVELSVEVVDGEFIPAAQALRGGYDLLYDDVTFVLPQTETRPMRAIGGKKDKSAGGRQALTVPLL